MNIRIKIWLEDEDSIIFGEGRSRLLQLIQKTGSLNKAAKEMKMSYRAAWGKIKDTERILGRKVLETKTGGTAGGGSSLTDTGLELLKAYTKFEEIVKSTAHEHQDVLLRAVKTQKESTE